MKRNIFKSLVLGAALFLGACGVPEVDGVKHGEGESTTVAISHIAVEESSVSFTLSPKEALSYDYAVTKEGDDRELVSADGKEVNHVEIENLEEGASYEIYAVAQNEEGDSTPVVTTFVAGEPYRRAVILKFTATWCVNCPAMTTVIDRMAQKNPDRIAVVAVHKGDHYEFAEGAAIHDNFKVGGVLPTVNFNYGVAQSASTSAAESVLSNALEGYLAEAATSDLKIEAKAEGGKLKVQVDAKAMDDSDYKLCVVVMEDDIYEPGTSGTKDGYYHHVSHAFLTDKLGDAISFEGGESTSEFEIDIDKEWNASKLHICAFTLKGGKVDNAATAEVE